MDGKGKRQERRREEQKRKNQTPCETRGQLTIRHTLHAIRQPAQPQSQPECRCSSASHSAVGAATTTSEHRSTHPIATSLLLTVARLWFTCRKVRTPCRYSTEGAAKTKTHHQYEHEGAEIVVALGRGLGAISERGVENAMQPCLHSLFKD